MEHNFNFDRCSTENPFSVPEGYFEDFCRRMEVLTTPKKISLLQRIRPYWYAAAMVVLILSIGVFFFQSRKIEEQNKQKMGLGCRSLYFRNNFREKRQEAFAGCFP